MQPPRMVRLYPYLNSNAQVRHLRISVPMVEPLLDGQKYFRPDALPPPAGEELRPRLTLTADRRSAHQDAALAQDDGNPRRPTVELAVEGRARPAALAQHLADRNATGGSQDPGGKTTP